MGPYPEQSHVAEWRVSDDGERLHLKVVHKDKRPESLLTFTYEQMGAVFAMIWDGFAQLTGVRAMKGKPVPAENPHRPQLPMEVVGKSALDIALDRNHVVLELQVRGGATFRFAMAPTRAEGIARKILNDLDSFPPPNRKH
jgi:hypothetical protein